MGPFFAGIIAAVVLAVIAGFGLNAFDTQTAERHQTEETVL